MNLTEEQAIALAELEIHKSMTDREIVEFQLFEPKQCMPFGVFKEAVEKVLDRRVFVHEFAFAERLQEEYLGDRQPPTFEAIMDLIPADKRIFIKL